MPRQVTFLLTLLLMAMPAIGHATPTRTAHITTSDGSVIALTLEVATTPTERAQGLSKRKAIAPYDGMLFVFEKPIIQKFWMKDTWIPLDILFVDAADRIVFIAHGTPMSEAPLGPDIPIATVIEIEAGRAAKNGINVGNDVQYTASHQNTLH